MTTPLHTPVRLGDLELPNRIIMAPLTRNRAQHASDAPHELNAEYYAQRASAGLIISEATQISPEGKGYAWTPGIHTPEQVAGWRTVTDAVHAAGGRIVAQLWHVGRVSHTSLQPDGRAPVAPSPIAAQTQVFDGSAMVAAATPRALELSEIPRIVDDYRRAARNAQDAGFDGIELHAANGYLLDQFLRDGSNRRDDEYGGRVENRARLVLEVLDALAEVWPAGRIGIRLSPFSAFNDMADSDPLATFGHLIERLSGRGLAYLHMIEGQTQESRDTARADDVAALHDRFAGAYVANNEYDRDLAIHAVDTGAADAIAFGRAFLANPDLPVRLAQGAPLNEPDESTFYGGGAEGYTDYPTLEELRAA